ncbi:two-component system chemotaxis sensor kinase CheA [Devosia subaequoris]|uniref:Chemotaxis protein CheA n=1 Tax=Devosia subaequoris TaxID=395930 RepID=A0A7W6IPJ9_9HYPH|nr:chemotaxis protein CheA [Devosia subaequoris]MBB4053385.1 two-component system chemotaxis sensor kinase CheA [Devosia subaequoris]MCP1210762.1 chemotaxis protein CheA [Devosia subaequoris]
MSDLDDFKATYFDECSELLTELEEQFAVIEEGERGADRLNAVFRAIHSIKGGAGAFGFTALVGFAHAYETLLDYVRDGRIELTDDVVVLCIRANDIVADHVNAAQTGEALPADYGAEEKARFDALARGETASDGTAEDDLDGEMVEEFDLDFTPVMVNLDAPAPTGEAPVEDVFDAAPMMAADGQWEIRFTPHRALYARANDPLLLFRELAALGEMSVHAVMSDVPPLSDFEPFGVYCAWEITLVAPGLGEDAIREVFEFVDGDCDIVIAQAGTVPGLAPDEPAMAAEVSAAPATDEPDLSSLLALTEEEVAAPVQPVVPPVEFVPEPPVAEVGQQDNFEEAPADLSFAALAAEIAPTPAPAPKAEKPAPVPNSAPAAKPVVPTGGGESEESSGRSVGVQSIRVDLDKVDRVVNMVGELVITQSMLTQQMDETLRARYTELVRGLEVLAQTTRGLQDSVMAIRAQPVKSVFSRMPRLVRELASKTSKKIKLETIGENTEIDKTVIEQLSDPLTHMIRNSADHGIESPEKRQAAGKPESGTIRLSAEQAGGNILIIVEDDGAGINRERVLGLARDKGIVAPDITPTDEQIDQLIFAPGFSTAEAVSDISGRGVGMDVVLSNIKKIGGSVHVRSWPGRGTRMTLRLPLTLAVLDVMLVKVGGGPYVVPLSSIVETMQCSRAAFERVPSGGRVLQVRGEYVQVIDLAQRFELTSQQNPDDQFVVLCEAEGNQKVALVVDDIIGQQQVVIKSLEENFESVEGIAGGTILGDGNVALIVDVQGLRTSPIHQNAA